MDLARTNVLLGLIANATGQSLNALVHLNTALTLYEQGNHQREIAIVCCNLGDIYLRRAEYPLSETFSHRAHTIAKRIGGLPLVATLEGNLGILEYVMN